MLGRFARVLLIASLTGALWACAASSPSGQVADQTSGATSTPPVTVPPATPTPTASPPPTPSPEPTVDLAAVGKAYLAIADVFATKGQPAVDAIAAGGSYTPKAWGEMHQAVVDVYDEVIPMLDQIMFPDDLADEAAQLRAYWVDTRALFAEVAAVPSVDNWDEFVELAQAYGRVGGAIRAYLGLPPRPTPPPE